MIRTITLFLGLLCLFSAATAQTSTASVVKEIIIEGNKAVLREAILGVMQTKEGKPFEQVQLAQDKSLIEQMGYFKAVDVTARPLTEAEWQIVVRVEEYPVVREIRVTGNTVVPTADILKIVTQPVGEVLNKRNLDTTRKALIDLYLARHYLADIERFEPMADSPSTLDLVIVEKTVNTINFRGLVKTKERTMRRLMKSKPGKPFNIKDFQSDMLALYDTQWFEKIDEPIETQVADDIGRFDYLINVKEASTRTFNVGLQLDPRNRLAGLIRVGDNNFNGTGQVGSIGYVQPTGGGGPSVDFTYSIPWIDNRDTSVTFSLYSRLQSNFGGTGFGDFDSPIGSERFDERRTGGFVSFSRPIGRNNSATIGIRSEEVKTVEIQNIGAENFIQQDGNVTVAEFALTRDTRNSRTEPTEGQVYRVSVEPGFSNIRKIGGGVAGNTDLLGRNTFVRSSVEYKHYWSRKRKDENALLPNLNKPVIAFRAVYGIITGKPPFFEQFFAGGSETVRGYPEQRFWGKQTFLSTLELRIPIQKSFFAAVFADYGGAWGGYGSLRDFTQTSSFRLHAGYGIGIGFRTPLGPIRIDFAFDEKGKNRTHFLIGSSF
ncbi:MAG: Outer membrane protein assembly factor BamA [Fimbriimonadaceae bacterium]|nr:Outer membrane protein assembly factor BamA [Fimbriimonadaceae bacterium]